MYRLTTLDNGLIVASATMNHMASVSLGFWVGVGGRYEPAELCGVSHFIEHLLFKGTHKRSAKQISQDVEGMGGDLNAFTSEENTCFFSKARHDRFDELLNVMMDMFLNSRFDPVEITKERHVIKEELAMYQDQPQQRVQELLNELQWPNHPLGRSLTGSVQTLDAMQRRHILGFQKKHYVAGNTLITLAGRLQHDSVIKAISKFARHFALGRRSCFAPAPIDQEAARVRLLTKTTEQTQLALGIRTCSRHDERRFALRLLNTVLGENMSSRLFQVVREDRGLAYSIGSSLGFFDDVGTLSISAGLDTEKLPAALKLIARELVRLTTTSLTRAELRRARDYLFGQIDLGLESTTNQMMWMGEQILGYGKIIPAERIKDRLAEVGPAQIRAAAREYFRPDRLSLALVSPLKTDRGLAHLLAL
jgi:predicted Zn-dependent peptidase